MRSGQVSGKIAMPQEYWPPGLPLQAVSLPAETPGIVNSESLFGDSEITYISVRITLPEFSMIATEDLLALAKARRFGTILADTYSSRVDGTYRYGRANLV
jgi:hypothetical protein